MPEDTDQRQPDNAPDNVAGESAPDSDAPQEQPAPAQPEQPTYPQIVMNLTPQGLVALVVPAPVQLGIGPEGMDEICEKWVSSRPALADKLIQMRVEQLRKAQERLQIVRDPAAIKRIAKSKNRLNA